MAGHRHGGQQRGKAGGTDVHGHQGVSSFDVGVELISAAICARYRCSESRPVSVIDTRVSGPFPRQTSSIATSPPASTLARWLPRVTLPRPTTARKGAVAGK